MRLVMSVAEIIEPVKALPPEEQMRVAKLVRRIEICRITEKIFDEHDELFRKLAEYEKAERDS